MLRKLTSETLERRTVFSASAIVALGGDTASFMDYTDDSVLAANVAQPAAVAGDFNADGDVDGADFLVWQRAGKQLAGDGFGLLPYLEQDNLHPSPLQQGQSGAATDAIMEHLGRDPQGIIAILIGLYAPKGGAADPTVQQLELENTMVSNFLAPSSRHGDQAREQSTAAAQPYLQLELENTMVSSVVARPGQHAGILHEDNEFSFPRM